MNISLVKSILDTAKISELLKTAIESIQIKNIKEKKVKNISDLISLIHYQWDNIKWSNKSIIEVTGWERERWGTEKIPEEITAKIFQI